MTYRIDAGEEKRDNMKKLKENHENSLVCMFTESETYEEFRMKASNSLGYSKMLRFLDPFWFHIFKKEHRSMYSFLEREFFMLTPIFIGLVLCFLRCYSVLNMLSLSFLVLCPWFLILNRNFSVSSKIETDEDWMKRHGEHFYKEDV